MEFGAGDWRLVVWLFLLGKLPVLAWRHIY